MNAKSRSPCGVFREATLRVLWPSETWLQVRGGRRLTDLLATALALHAGVLSVGCTGGARSYEQACVSACHGVPIARGERQQTAADVEQGMLVRIEPLLIVGPALQVLGPALLSDIMKWPEGPRRNALTLADIGTYWSIDLALVVTGPVRSAGEVTKYIGNRCLEIRSSADGPSCKCRPAAWGTGNECRRRSVEEMRARPVGPPSRRRLDGTAVFVVWVEVPICAAEDAMAGSMYVNIERLFDEVDFRYESATRDAVVPRGFVRVPVIDAAPEAR